MAKCKMCYQEKPLSNGHIIPRWCGRLGENKQMIKTIPRIITPDGRIKDATTGKYLDIAKAYEFDRLEGLASENIFCEACDNKLGDGESLIREIVHPTGLLENHISRVKNKFGVKDTFRITTPNKEVEFIQACIGMLWKAHLATEPLYKNFILLSNHVKIIRDAIEKEKINDGRFLITIKKLYNFGGEIFAPKGSTLANTSPPYGIAGVTQVDDQYIIIGGGFLISLTINKQNGKNQNSKFRTGRPYSIMPVDLEFLISQERIFDPREAFNPETASVMWNALYESVNKPEFLEFLCPCFVFYSKKDEKDKKLSYRKLFNDCCYPYWF